MNTTSFFTLGPFEEAKPLSKDEELHNLRTQVGNLRRVLEDYKAEPAPIAFVVEVNDATTLIVAGGLQEIRTPKIRELRDKLRPGAPVHVHHQTHAIRDVLDEAPFVGPVFEVARVLDRTRGRIEIRRPGNNPPGVAVCDPKCLPHDNDRVMLDPSGVVVIKNLGPGEKRVEPGRVAKVMSVVGSRAEIEMPGNQGSVLLPFECDTAPEPGHRVVLDPSGVRIVENLGEPPLASGVSAETGVSWDDIGGLEDVKRELREAIAGPTEDAALYKRFGRKPLSGVLLSGRPGNGKTMLAKACATEMARLHGKAYAPSGYVYVKGPALLNMFVGKSEENVRKLFEDAKRHKAKHGYPAIICLDEADALLARRGAARIEGMERTVVPAFLAEMDGLEESAAFVMVLTNRPDMLDPGITRDKRLDLKIEVRSPSKQEAIDIAAKHLRGQPMAKGVTEGAAARAAADELYSPRHVLYMLRSVDGKDDRRFVLGDIASGAMMAGLIDRAVRAAMAREKATGKVSGITLDDLAAAAARICLEQLALDHENDLRLLVSKIGANLKSVEKSKPTAKEN